MSEFNEPWKAEEIEGDDDKLITSGTIKTSGEVYFCVDVMPTVDGQDRFLKRIVACVNACKGIPTEALESGRACVTLRWRSPHD